MLLGIIFLIVEFSFDFVESTIGYFVELTNGFRPKTGTIWQQDQKDKIAEEKLAEISQQLPKTEIRDDIQDLTQLKTILDEQGNVLISSNQFLRIYTTLPPASARQLISPFTLIRLTHTGKWTETQLSKGDQQLSIFFLDADHQLLMDSYPPLSAIFNVSSLVLKRTSSLNSMPQFAGRSVPADQFFDALLSLPTNIQRQLISNPFQLVVWQKNLQAVAISQYVRNYTVQLGFEIVNGYETRVKTFEASQLAVSYLITRLNEMYPEINLSMPRM